MSESYAHTQDRRTTRSWRHEEAKRMKLDGEPLSVIATRFDRSVPAVSRATNGVKSSAPRGINRDFRGPSSGSPSGQLKRVAISFSEEQISSINIIAEGRGFPFSKTVSDLVDMALEEISA